MCDIERQLRAPFHTFHTCKLSRLDDGKTSGKISLGKGWLGGMEGGIKAMWSREEKGWKLLLFRRRRSSNNEEWRRQ